jgi:hypothetical protein
MIIPNPDLDLFRYLFCIPEFFLEVKKGTESRIRNTVVDPRAVK